MYVSDTGPHFYLHGEHYYRQIDELSMSICVAKLIADSEWEEFLENSLRLGGLLGRKPKVIVASFAHAYPNAPQRRQTTTFLERHNVPTIARLGVVTDNPLLRGAIVAFSWVVPQATMRSFASRDIAGCLRWLQGAGTFDLPRAVTAWHEGRAAFRGKC
jgi:hypothetical protein